MAEFNYPQEQTIPYGQSAILNNTSCVCNKGYISHQDGFGGITVKGIVNNPCANFARYLIQFSGNIALPEGATVGEIGVGISYNGEVFQDTIASVTPTVVESFFHVGGFKTIDIPKGCCPTIAIENVSPATGTTPNPSIIMRNLNVAITRTA